MSTRGTYNFPLRAQSGVNIPAKLLPQTVNYVNRVRAAGGTVYNIALVNNMYLFLKNVLKLNICSNLGLFISPNFGVKNIAGATEMAYCLFGNDVSANNTIANRKQHLFNSNLNCYEWNCTGAGVGLESVSNFDLSMTDKLHIFSISFNNNGIVSFDIGRNINDLTSGATSRFFQIAKTEQNQYYSGIFSTNGRNNTRYNDTSTIHRIWHFSMDRAITLPNKECTISWNENFDLSSALELTQDYTGNFDNSKIYVMGRNDTSKTGKAAFYGILRQKLSNENALLFVRFINNNFKIY